MIPLILNPMLRSSRVSVGGACYNKHYHSSGHIWQGRYRAFPIEEDDYLLTVLRYAERNPVRAELVTRAELWP